MSTPSSSISAEPAPLCIADAAVFWPWRGWTEFARWPDKAATTVVLPVVGLADWGLEAPLDVEESVALSVLRAATLGDGAAAGRVLVLPPQRFAAGPSAMCAFAVDVPTALAAIDEWCASVAAAGFSRIVLYNSSPWNEELLDAAARDIRIARGLQMFCVNLSALGLDFAPWRGGERAGLRALIAEIEAGEAATAFAGGGATAPAPTVAMIEPGPLVKAAGARLAGLFGEIAARPPLPNGGAIKTMNA